MDQHIPHPHIPHIPHPHIELRKLHWKKHKEGSQDFNSWLAVRITAIVGTMWCAYAFAALALISLPAALSTGQLIVIVAWIAQTFLQLVLLSIIIVGQNIAAASSDKRAESTYLDAEAVLVEAQQIQQHLAVQDAALEILADKLGAELPKQAAAPTRLPGST
jgi:hypothetical protein